MLKRLMMLCVTLAIAAPGANAGEDITAVQLFDPAVDLKWTTASGGTNKLLVVAGLHYGGTDSTDQSQWGYSVLGFDAKTGDRLWSFGSSTFLLPDIVTSVAVGKKVFCIAGAKGDGDGGANAFVECRSTKDISGLWYHEYENPFGDAIPVHYFAGPEATDDSCPTVEIFGKRVLLRVPYNNGASDEQVSVVAFDIKTGDPL